MRADYELKVPDETQVVVTIYGQIGEFERLAEQMESAGTKISYGYRDAICEAIAAAATAAREHFLRSVEKVEEEEDK